MLLCTVVLLNVLYGLCSFLKLLLISFKYKPFGIKLISRSFSHHKFWCDIFTLYSFQVLSSFCHHMLTFLVCFSLSTSASVIHKNQFIINDFLWKIFVYYMSYQFWQYDSIKRMDEQWHDITHIIEFFFLVFIRVKLNSTWRLKLKTLPPSAHPNKAFAFCLFFNVQEMNTVCQVFSKCFICTN